MKQKLKSLPFKTHTYIYYLSCFAGAVIMLAGCQISQPLARHSLLYLGMGIFAAGLIWRMLFMRCPHCGSALYNSRSIPTHCPNCGKELP